MSNGDQSRLVTVDEAARLLGKSTDAIRALVRRGTLEARRGNDGRPRVVLPPGRETVATVERPPDDRARPIANASEWSPDMLVAELRAERDAARAEATELYAALAEERVAKARIEGERDTARMEAAGLRAALAADAELAGELRAALAKAEARADRLEAALVEARRPWLARVLEGLRRRG